MRQERHPLRQLVQAGEPGIGQQVFLLGVFVDAEPGLLVQVEVSRAVIVLRLLERPIDLLTEIGGAAAFLWISGTEKAASADRENRL